MGTYTITQGLHYFNNQWCEGSQMAAFDSINPATGKVLGSFPQATQSEVDSVYHFARDSFYGWRTYSRVQRAEYFLKLASLIEER